MFVYKFFLHVVFLGWYIYVSHALKFRIWHYGLFIENEQTYKKQLKRRSDAYEAWLEYRSLELTEIASLMRIKRQKNQLARVKSKNVVAKQRKRQCVSKASQI